MRKEPFYRSQNIASMIRAAHALPTFEGVQAALALIPGYRSRGHGEGLLGNKHSRHCVAMDKRAARKARNKRRS